MSATDFTRELTRRQIDFEVISHPPTHTAREEALAVGLVEVAKTLVVATGQGYVRVVLPADRRIDLRKVCEVLGGAKDARLASESELAVAYPTVDLGAVPPFWGGREDRAILDRRLAVRESVVLEAGSHERSVRLRVRDLVRLAEPLIADVCEG